jgi:MraZ protein
MTNFIGEYNCKLDVKGRVMLPAGLKKQVSPDAEERFVVNRGFEKCLVLYPMDVWKKISADVNKLNLYNKQNRDFARYFYRGATELSLDANNRLLLPKGLMAFAGIKKEAVLFAYNDRVEVWSKDQYEKLMTEEPEDFAVLAEKVMGSEISKDSEDNVS